MPPSMTEQDPRGYATPPTTSTGGRPAYDIGKETLEYLLSLNFKMTTIASMIGVSTKTIQRRFK